MNQEKIPNVESPRDRLISLEKTGKYVFHGTMGAFELLEPRQPTNDNRQTGEREKHGEPAVCASPYADAAIFSALIKANASNIGSDSNCQFGITDDNHLHFESTANLLDKAKGIIGKVYVLDKKDFKEFEGVDWRSERNVVPLQVVDVTVEDLPKNIKVIE